MLPLSLYRSRGFASMNASMLGTVTGMFGMIFLFSQYLQTVRGYTPLGAGLRALPWTASPAVSAVVAGLLTRRVGGRQLIAAGAALQATGIGLLAVQTSATVPYIQLIPAFVIAGCGIGVFFAPITRLTLGFAPAELEGIASGTSAALRQLGTVIGVAVLGAVFSAHGSLTSPAAFVRGLDAALAVSAVILGISAFLPLLAPDPERQARTATGKDSAAGAAAVAGR
jgi:MFS family permease